MGKTKEEKAKVKKRKDSASRDSSSSRSRLEQTVARTDPSGSTADGRDDDNASVLSVSSSGVSGYAGTLGPRQSKLTRNTGSKSEGTAGPSFHPHQIPFRRSGR